MSYCAAQNLLLREQPFIKTTFISSQSLACSHHTRNHPLFRQKTDCWRFLMEKWSLYKLNYYQKMFMFCSLYGYSFTPILKSVLSLDGAALAQLWVCVVGKNVVQFVNTFLWSISHAHINIFVSSSWTQLPPLDLHPSPLPPLSQQIFPCSQFLFVKTHITAILTPSMCAYNCMFVCIYSIVFYIYIWYGQNPYHSKSFLALNFFLSKPPSQQSICCSEFLFMKMFQSLQVAFPVIVRERWADNCCKCDNDENFPFVGNCSSVTAVYCYWLHFDSISLCIKWLSVCWAFSSCKL